MLGLKTWVTIQANNFRQIQLSTDGFCALAAQATYAASDDAGMTNEI